jgi:CheY-like chemotaxis protein
LGLSVVHGIVKSHGGLIATESTPGQGTTFHLYFPALGTTGIETSTPATSDQPSSVTLNVMIVDDEVALAQGIAKVLAQRGHRPTHCSSAATAIHTVTANPNAFDLVIADYNMPRTSGLELAEQLKQRGCNVPVVLMSGNVSAELQQRAAALGVRSILPKPFSWADLRDAIDGPPGAQARA